jgi:hypothetical protein
MKRVRDPRNPMSFDPETTPILVEAFDAAWHDLYAAGCKLAVGPEAEAARERLARRIIAQAQQGVRDPIELSSDGVAHVLAAAANARTQGAEAPLGAADMPA